MEKRISITKLPPQQDMLQLVPPRRSKMFLKWQELRIQMPPPGKKCKPKKRLHIWQKVERLKEINVLEDYYWFYEEWDRINKRFMKRFNKTFPELLMERIHHHRIKMENAMLLAKCILALAEEDSSGKDMKWEKTLRTYPWFQTSGVPAKPLWDDGSKATPPVQKESEDMDRIGRADRDNIKFEYFKDWWAHLAKGADEWGPWETFCFKIAIYLDRFEPHYPDFVNPPEFSGLLILGKRMKPPPPPPPPPPCAPIAFGPHNRVQTLTRILGPAAMISLTYHFFVNQVGEQSTKEVVLENYGETVLFYRWERRPMETLVTAPKVHLGPHITDCQVFGLINGAGSIHSGGKRTFQFTFKSNVPGVFLESWVCRTLPRLPSNWSLDPIFLKGVAFSEDHFARLRDKLSRILYHRERMSSINEFFVNALNWAGKGCGATQEVRSAGDYMFSSTAFNFLQKNLAMEPPVYYVPSSYQQLKAFAIVVKAWELPPPIESKPAPPAKGKAPPPKVPLNLPEEPIKEEPPWAWDGSFSSIVTGIEGSSMSERIKQHFRSELVTLKELVQIPPHQTMLLHVVVYKLLHGITDHTEDVMEKIPLDFGRPMAETLMNNYYEKYEQERSEKVAEAAARMEDDPQAAEADKMESLLEQINIANPPLNEISLESRIGNQDMLEYCFKWLHILTEMRMFMQVGFHDTEEQVQKEQQHLNELVQDRICKLIPFMDDTSAWDQFALERAKQGLLEGEKKLLKINEEEPTLEGKRELSDCAFYELCLGTKIND